MSGTYTKGDDILDSIWMQFLEDVRGGELEEIAGMPASVLLGLQIDFSDIESLQSETMNRIRQQVAEIMKEYRTSRGERKRETEKLITAHGAYCKMLSSAKWKRVHNVLAYRYANPAPLTIRMIARKIGKGKEETDHDIREGLDNITLLMCGYPAIIQAGADAYDSTTDIIRNYALLKNAASVRAAALLPDDLAKISEQSRKTTERIIQSFDSAIRLYSIFCEGYGNNESRRLDALKSIYLEKKESVPAFARRSGSGVSTIQNDCRINAKRISELLTGKRYIAS